MSTTNAIRIAYELAGATPAFDMNPEAIEEVERAADGLQRLEDTNGFEWDGQPSDWESVCARIADSIAAGSHDIDWFVHLQKEFGLRAGKEKPPLIYVSVQGGGETVKVHIPRSANLDLDFTLLDCDDPTPDGDHGNRHPDIVRRDLEDDPKYVTVELDR